MTQKDPKPKTTRTLDNRGGILVECSSPGVPYKVCYSVLPSMVNLLAKHGKLESFLEGSLYDTI